MKHWTRLMLTGLCLAVWSSTLTESTQAETLGAPPVLYEMRVYYPHPGKFEEMLARFRNHTCELFAKHGITNVAYFVSTDHENPKLVYWISYPKQSEQKKRWEAFLNDPEWKAAYAKSHENGPLVKKVESRFMTLTDYSPEFPGDSAKDPRVFELRTYVASEGNLEALNSRFREHTCDLFAKHGMTNIAYFKLLPDQPGAESTLVYLIAHPSQEARKQAFQQFAADSTWQTAKAASEKKAGGSLTAPNGVQFEFLTPTNFSPLK